MDETADKEQVQKQSNDQSQKNEEYSGNTNSHPQRTRYSESSNKLKRNRSRTHVNSQKRQNRHSHSRSHSPDYTKYSRQWISSNAFINFIQDFRKNFAGVRSTKIYQMAGKRWRTMSPAQKQPYLSAALSNRNKRQIEQNVENMQQPDTKTKENAKDKSTDNQQKVSKKERKKRKSDISPKKRTKSESDSDSMASGTTGSNTTDDFSDDSS